MIIILIAILMFTGGLSMGAGLSAHDDMNYGLSCYYGILSGICLFISGLAIIKLI